MLRHLNMTSMLAALGVIVTCLLAGCTDPSTTASSSPATSTSVPGSATGPASGADALLVRPPDELLSRRLISIEGTEVATLEGQVGRIFTHTGSPHALALVFDGTAVQLSWFAPDNLSLEQIDAPIDLSPIALGPGANERYLLLSNDRDASVVIDFEDREATPLEVPLAILSGRAVGERGAAAFDTDRGLRFIDLESGAVSQTLAEFATLGAASPDGDGFLYRDGQSGSWIEYRPDGATVVVADGREVLTVGYLAEGATVVISQSAVLVDGATIAVAGAGASFSGLAQHPAGMLLEQSSEEGREQALWLSAATGQITTVVVPDGPFNFVTPLSKDHLLIEAIDGSSIWAIDLTGRGPELLGELLGGRLLATPTPVGRWLGASTLVDRQPQYWLIDPNTLDVEVIEGALALAIAPGGTHVAYTLDEPRRVVVAAIDDPTTALFEAPGTLIGWLPG